MISVRWAYGWHQLAVDFNDGDLRCCYRRNARPQRHQRTEGMVAETFEGHNADPSAGSSRHAPPTIQELLQALFKVDRLGAMIGITIIGRWAWDLGDARYRNRFATVLRPTAGEGLHPFR